MRKGWFVCKIVQQSETEFVLQPVGHKHHARQWALDALLNLHRDAPQEGPYAIVEVDESPSWDSVSYGTRKAAPAATL